MPSPLAALMASALLVISACNLAATSSARDGASSESNGNKPSFNNPTSSTTVEGSKLTVQATNIRNLKGKVIFYLFDGEKAWKASEENGKAFRELSAEIVAGKTPKENTAEVVFENLPKGEYAVQLLHDENKNGEMDTSLGMPKEGYGMSNDPKIGMSMPKWNDCKFAVSEKDQAIAIKMKY